MPEPPMIWSHLGPCCTQFFDSSLHRVVPRILWYILYWSVEFGFPSQISKLIPSLLQAPHLFPHSGPIVALQSLRTPSLRMVPSIGGSLAGHDHGHLASSDHFMPFPNRVSCALHGCDSSLSPRHCAPPPCFSSLILRLLRACPRKRSHRQIG